MFEDLEDTTGTPVLMASIAAHLQHLLGVPVRDIFVLGKFPQQGRQGKQYTELGTFPKRAPELRVRDQTGETLGRTGC